MNALIVYATHYKNTEHVAQKITTTLGKQVNVAIIPVEGVRPTDLAGIDLIIFGSPTRARRATGEIKALVKMVREACPATVQAAIFDTRLSGPAWLTGSAGSDLANVLKKEGIPLLFHPASFRVAGISGPLAPGELERAVGWATSILAAAEGAGRRLSRPVPALAGAD